MDFHPGNFGELSFLSWVEARDRETDGQTDTAGHFITPLPTDVGA